MLGGTRREIGDDLNMGEKALMGLLTTIVIGCISQPGLAPKDIEYCEAAAARRSGVPRIDAIAIEVETRDWSFDDEVAPEEAFTAETLDRLGYDFGELGALCRCLAEEEADEPRACKEFREYLASFT